MEKDDTFSVNRRVSGTLSQQFERLSRLGTHMKCLPSYIYEIYPRHNNDPYTEFIPGYD